MGQAWRWWSVWVVVGICLMGAGRAAAECKDEAAKGRVPASQAKGKDWTWKDADGCVRTRAELDAMLSEHQTWIKTDSKGGKRADLSLCDLTGVDLRGALLDHAYLSGSFIRGSLLSGASLRDARMVGTQLRGSDMENSDLGDASLIDADLSEVYLSKVNLSGADISMADLRDTELSGSNVNAMIYEPKWGPLPVRIAFTANLGHLTWGKDSLPIYTLHKSLLDGGFVIAAKQVTAAIHRHSEGWPERILFDWTCEWGSNWLRPVRLLGLLCLIFGPVYWVGMHFGRVGGIYQIVLDKVVATKAANEVVTRVETGVRWVGREQLRTRTVEGSVRVRSPKLRWRLVGMALRAEWRALRLAFLFSVLSALDIGFHEFNVGVWARMLLARDFNLKARGWMRVAGGVQSLVGLGLVALSLLSYFGHPFD